MKLIIAIVQDEDSARLLTGLMQKGIGVTKLATTGGFLKAGNTTLLIGIEDERVQEAIHAIESVCRSRKQLTAAQTPSAGTGIAAGGFVPYPVEVTVGGATLFVLNVDQFLKI